MTRNNLKSQSTRTLLACVLLTTALGACKRAPRDDPWAGVTPPQNALSHAAFFHDKFADGPAVTRACLKCHEEQAHDFMKTAHWTWKGAPAEVPGHEGLKELGKANLINNFCIGVQPNLPACTKCHAGYGWEDQSFDFKDVSKVDCLVCHDKSGQYAKGRAGIPREGTDLLAAAKSVGRPGRTNCGVCHFDGGGGDAVKHGDLDRTLMHPTARIDVHMGQHKLVCVDCHKSKRHQISGRSMSVSTVAKGRAYCTDCHAKAPHTIARLNAHTEAVACPTCHIPKMAVQTPTKLTWDWSTAGQDRPESVHHYLKIKGSFTYGAQVVPEYAWYNGRSNRYLLGDRIDPEGVTKLTEPRGDIHDPSAKIWPFKVHRGRQVYDKKTNTFLVPKTAGEGGFWTEFDWHKALSLGAKVVGQDFSGEYGFAETEMAWPLAHMVAGKAESLQCADCHREGGRLDWLALGYAGDPAKLGARRATGDLGFLPPLAAADKKEAR